MTADPNAASRPKSRFARVRENSSEPHSVTKGTASTRPNAYSARALIRNAISGHKHWKPAWRSAAPRGSYDVVIIGGGGHGLATSYYLAKEYGIRKVAVLERSNIGLGNTGRNTTIVRSNYLLPSNIAFYEQSLRMWEGLTHELNFNLMFSQRGMIQLFHSESQMHTYARRGNAMLLSEADAELLGRNQLARMIPQLDLSARTRFPITGALLQRRAGTARHDAVAWAYARAASKLGVDIVENCEVTGFVQSNGRIDAIETNRGLIVADSIGIAVAGDTSDLAAKAGLKLPIETHVLQAFVTEPVKPILNHIITYGRGRCYVSQTDKGELVVGGDIEGSSGYVRRGGLDKIEKTVIPLLQMFPSFAELRMLRSWAGAVDMSMDGSPIISTTSVRNLFLNGGWCYGGFKAIPASGLSFAHLIAQGQPNALVKPFCLSRFESGRIIDEEGTGPFPNAH